MSGATRAFIFSIPLLAVAAWLLSGSIPPIQAQGSVLSVGCEQGSDVFDLFEPDNPFPFNDEKISASTGSNGASQTITNLRGVDTADGVVKPIRITPGTYRVYAIAGDDHFAHGNGEPGYDEQPFESFYVELDGQLAERPTPDRGIVGNATGLEYYVGAKAPFGLRKVFDAAGYNLADYELDASNNGDFDNGTDFMGRFKHDDTSGNLYDALPPQLTDSSRADYDLGAYLGNITTTNTVSEISFYHFFHPRFGNSNDDPVTTPSNPNGIRYDNVFAHYAHSSHIGVIRLECVSDDVVDVAATTDLTLSTRTARPGDTVTVDYRACGGLGLGDATLTLERSVDGGVWQQIADNRNVALNPCVERDELFTPTIGAVGSEFCYRSTVTPQSTSNPSVLRSDVECVQVIDELFIQVAGGDVVAGLGYGADCSLFDNATIQAYSSSRGGSEGEYRISASGAIDGFGSAGDHLGNKLTFANATLGQLGNFSDGQCRELPKLVADSAHAGDLTLSTRTTQSTSVISVDGDLRITGDLLAGVTTTNISDAPIFILRVAGDVFIDPQVQEIHAVILSSGTVFTCANMVAGSAQKDPALCTEPLEINGAVSANQLDLGRSGGGIAAGVASELFVRPAWLDLLSLELEDDAIADVAIAQFRDLPPIIR